MREARRGGVGVAAAFLAALPLFGACASQQVVDDYEAEILELREERTELKKRNRDMQDQLQQYEVALQEANARIGEATARTAELEATYDPELDAAGISAFTRDGNVVYSMTSGILFASGSASLTDEGDGTLETLATRLSREHASDYYWVEGHTDTDPISKSNWDSNRDLSLARSMAVLHYLVEDAGVDDDRCVVVGHGQYSPAVAGDTQEAKAKNRRVEVIVKQP